MGRAAGFWQSELARRNINGSEAEDLLRSIGDLMTQVEEANVLCSEVQSAVPTSQTVEMDIGLAFSFLSSSRLPAVVVQVWNRREGRMIAAWPAADFERRLHGLRDMHREVLKSDRHTRWAWRLSREEWWAGGGPTDDDAEASSDAEGPQHES